MIKLFVNRLHYYYQRLLCHSLHRSVILLGIGAKSFTKFIKPAVLSVVLLACVQTTIAQTATWIWYPGDWEISLSNKMQNRRTERGVFFPVFWKIDNHYVLMDFHKVFNLTQPEEVNLYVEGEYNVKIDGKAFEGSPSKITVPAGKHKINIKVFNQQQVPAVFVQGKTIVSDNSWLVTFEDKEWIDETGKTSDISATKWLSAGSSNLNDPTKLPSTYALPVKPEPALSLERKSQALIADFGKETFGFLKLHGVKGQGKLIAYYGESKEESLSEEHSETFDRLTINATAKQDTVITLSKAFRFVNLQYEKEITVDSMSVLYEYADIKDKGSFKSSDEELNRIYDVSKYTLHLTTREFFIDGVKRDRWVWSGDAYQSYLMNYYLTNDNETVKRTMYALRGKDPVTGHINTIMDYTFYWFLSIYDYYLYSGDKSFIAQNYDRMQSLMEYCLGRRNKEGLMEGLPGDWVFIDWATGLSKAGAVSFEQLLLCRSLETMAICAELANDKEGAARYKKEADVLKKKLFDYYWNETKQALVHSRVNGQQTDNVTRYANMFSIFFDYFTEQQKQAVKNSVLLNNGVQKITTPYMRFYELEALCAMGEQTYVLKEMKDYWGGMLKLGATSFWEEYNPDKTDAEHYAMYGREFGKSLCHSWGASPLYLLGKYYLGVKPLEPGYSQYEIAPQLGGLQWMEGKVPTPDGNVKLAVTTKQIKVTGAAGTGVLKFSSKTKPVCKEGVVTDKGNGKYELTVEKNKTYTVKYKAI